MKALKYLYLQYPYISLLTIVGLIFYWLFNIYSILLILPFGMTILFIKFINKNYQDMENSHKIRSNFVQSINMLYYETKLKHLSLINGIKETSISSNNKEVCSYFKSISRRVTYGEKLIDALDDKCPNEIYDMVSSIKGNISSGMDFGKSSYSVYKSEINKENDLSEYKAYSAQKYSTLGILASIVMPSFIMFGVIGYSIINSFLKIFWAFSIVLTCIIPPVYLIIKLKMKSVDFNEV